MPFVDSLFVFSFMTAVHVFAGVALGKCVENGYEVAKQLATYLSKAEMAGSKEGSLATPQLATKV
jgi:hypothetical protein